MTNEEKITQLIRQKLIQVKNTLPKEFPMNEKFREQWGLDSMDLVELVARIEQHFRIEIADEDIKEFTTLQRIVDYLVQKDVKIE